MAAIAWLPEPQKEVFEEDQISLPALAQLFRQSFYNVAHQDDEVFVLQSEGLSFMVFLDQRAKLIRFVSLYRIHTSAPLKRKYAYLNEMNHAFNLSTFCIAESEPDVVIADHSLLYEQGVRTWHIVSPLIKQSPPLKNMTLTRMPKAFFSLNNRQPLFIY